jgi:hypothetical protein
VSIQELQEVKMPQGIVPISLLEPHPRTAARPNGSHWLRWNTRLRRGALDDQIARGFETAGDERLALRAAQLTSRKERDRLARALEHTLELAAAPAESVLSRTAPVLSARVPLRSRDLRECANDVEALVARLRDAEPIDPQGAAMTRRLLVDGASPFYYRRSSVTLRHAVRSARLALEPVSIPVEVEVPLAA